MGHFGDGADAVLAWLKFITAEKEDRQHREQREARGNQAKLRTSTLGHQSTLQTMDEIYPHPLPKAIRVMQIVCLAGVMVFLRWCERLAI